MGVDMVIRWNDANRKIVGAAEKCCDLSTSHVFSTPFYLRILLLICIDHICITH